MKCQWDCGGSARGMLGGCSGVKVFGGIVCERCGDCGQVKNHAMHTPMRRL